MACKNDDEDGEWKEAPMVWGKLHSGSCGTNSTGIPKWALPPCPPPKDACLLGRNLGVLAVHQSLRSSWIASPLDHPHVNATNAPVIPISPPCSDHHTCSILHNHLTSPAPVAAAAVAGRATSYVTSSIETAVIFKSWSTCLWLQIRSSTTVCDFPIQWVVWAFDHELIMWRCLWGGLRG